MLTNVAVVWGSAPGSTAGETGDRSGRGAGNKSYSILQLIEFHCGEYDISHSPGSLIYMRHELHRSET